MRGQAELTNANEKISAKSGLDTEYITHWSYGIGETWSLLIPNVKGGATGAIAKNTEAMQKADPSVREYVAQIGNHYWEINPERQVRYMSEHSSCYSSYWVVLSLKVL